jgi:hypothetical protein
LAGNVAVVGFISTKRARQVLADTAKEKKTSLFF